MPTVRGSAAAGPARWPTLVVEAAALICLLIVTLHLFTAAAAVTPFHGDEGHYLYTARYFDYLFLKHDLTRPDWAENYWTLTQPMLTRYLVGSSLWVHGDDLQALPNYYDFEKTFAQNQIEGRVPAPQQLADARAAMVVFASAAMLVLYALGRALDGPIAGILAAALALASPLTGPLLVRAWAEAPLVFFLLLSLWLLVLGIRRANDGSVPLVWAVGAGLALGLGLATKLTMTMNLASVAAGGASLMLLVAVRTRRQGFGARFRQMWRIGRSWILLVAIALGVFVVSNPHLYPNPPRLSAHLFKQRTTEMTSQAHTHPRYALFDLPDRMLFMLGGSFVSGAAGGPPARDEDFVDQPVAEPPGIPFEIPLAVAGGVSLMAACRRSWRRQRRIPAEAFVLLTLGVYLVVSSATVLVAIERYLLPTLYLGTLLSALGATALTRQAKGFIRFATFSVSDGRGLGLRRLGLG